MRVRGLILCVVAILGLGVPISSEINLTEHLTSSQEAKNSKVSELVVKPPLSVSKDIQLTFDRIAVPTPVRVEKPVTPPEAVEEPTSSNSPNVVVSPPPATSPAPAVAPVELTPSLPAARVIHVALAGGQDVVDWQAGPVLFPLAGWPPYVAEHDFAGGWARFGSLSVGMNVTMTGLVTGTYTVGKIINVPRGGSTADLYEFQNQMPKVMLQTCIPGTNRMMVVGLY